ncbi:PaaX family transcriptional regulator C-terminal domain-containing protein [Polymorphospora sp. NPDC051019]|uniref:PaaX family transcriptional regulator n=1 Tax=Polymorphospora sp. NPDC051019 TaxID=3155725 RepID=UPI00342ECA5C
MDYPFDIEEIFAREGLGSIRLPRRQAGSSPQGLTVTLLADYTVSTGAWLPSAAIVALLAESGVSSAGARAAISRLARRGVLESNRQGRKTFYRLTQSVAAHLRAGGGWVASYGAGTAMWDDRWTLVAFSLPQEAALQRRALRNHLRWMGFAPLYDALWISPREFAAKAWSELDEMNLDALTVFRARHLDIATGAGRNPIDAWDLSAIATQYETFIRRWRQVVAGVHAGQLAGAQAVRTRTEVMDTYRRFSTLDPQLPEKLLPAGWLRQAARDVFVAVYDGLADSAEQHVRAVAAAHAAGPLPEIHANTVADLLSGDLPERTPVPSSTDA